MLVVHAFVSAVTWLLRVHLDFTLYMFPAQCDLVFQKLCCFCVFCYVLVLMCVFGLGTGLEMLFTIGYFGSEHFKSPQPTKYRLTEVHVD